ncbi:hypothetical protein CYMTET_4189 [Cymbomonas tetramitiformis]|uniref:Uncharacterized protein n=1 Tax=Cymbomonas tetramitiformis TaxID=36881 RepID=A0AAE0H1T3_9CHLO|nr:hypothetical protein CYMTET_4189 [Cymbomonas tetramitiformis]
MSQNFVSTKIATQRLGITGRILRGWSDKGYINTIRTSGNTRLFDVDGFLADHADGKLNFLNTKLFVKYAHTREDDAVTTWKTDIEAMFKLVQRKSEQAGCNFFIDFDKAYLWVGFTHKSNAKRHLMQFFEEDVDYTMKTNNILPDITNVVEKHGNNEIILITAECFKTICMTAETAQGKRVRKYYLELERRVREGDLTLAGEVVQNYDRANGVHTQVLLRTDASETNGPPEWVTLWKEARGDQKEMGKVMRGIIKSKGVKDPRVYQEVENIHNQSVWNFEGWTRQYLKENGIRVNAAAEAMNKKQLNVREQFSDTFCKRLIDMDAPTAQSIRKLAEEIKVATLPYTKFHELQEYKPKHDDQGNPVPCGKRVRQLESAHRRSQKRLATLERRRALETAPGTTNNLSVNL